MSTRCPSASRRASPARSSRRRCPSAMKKVALITGASAGLGVEFARQLSARGHRLVLVARRKERLEQLAKELGKASAVAIDLSKADAAAKLMADIEASGESVDLLVNNAGFGLIGNFAELDAVRERQMIDLNVGALTELCRAVAPRMIKRKSGAILNVASTAAFQPGPKMAVYFATKAFVLSLQRGVARGAEAARHQRHLPVPGPDPHRVRRGRGLRRQRPVRPGRDGCAGGGRRPASTGSTKTRRWSFRAGEQDRRGEHALRAALGRSQDRRSDQILKPVEPARRAAVAHGMNSAGKEPKWLRPTRSTADSRARFRSRACRRRTAAAASPACPTR